MPGPSPADTKQRQFPGRILRYPARALLGALMYFAVAVSERRIRKALRPKPGPGSRPVSR
jgi:hypothetical protein